MTSSAPAFTVVERLGSGATAYALLVEHDGVERVLKVARAVDHNDRLRDEGAVLEQLSHACVVRLYGTAEIGDRVGLLLSYAGQTTLGHTLREQGRLHLDMLERWGCDLLEALVYLESMGVPHRDIKPDNLGIAERPGNREKHLVLFDFSLSRASADNLHAGTTGYVDPFLPERRSWDLHADRWAATVTLFQMATGDLPRFGDGRSRTGGDQRRGDDRRRRVRRIDRRQARRVLPARAPTGRGGALRHHDRHAPRVARRIRAHGHDDRARRRGRR